MESSLVNEEGARVNYADRTVDSVCPYCGVGCQTKVHVKDDKILYVDGKDGPAKYSLPSIENFILSVINWLPHLENA